MSIENITSKILSDAREKAHKIVEDAQAQAEQILSDAAAEAQQKRDVAMTAAAQEVQMTEERILSSAKMEEKKLLLQTKQELLSQSFVLALEKIESMSDEAYNKLLSDMMIKLIETGDEEIIMNERDRKRLSPDFVYYVNRTGAKDEVPCNVKFSAETRDIPSGFILKRGDIEINATFDALLRQRREEMSAEVVKILF